MHYYQDERFGYSNSQTKNDYNNKSCCFKKVEETFCCFPSYYNEEDTKDERKEDKCWEGTFKICPKQEHDYKKDYDNEKDCDKRHNNRNNNQCHRCFNPCCWLRRW